MRSGPRILRLPHSQLGADLSPITLSSYSHLVMINSLSALFFPFFANHVQSWCRSLVPLESQLQVIIFMYTITEILSEEQKLLQ